mmetsp:Transcript_900/g.1421  ORF Transcript_900/g.1421 Transcript_900/m.1421 type:complete len:252 (+) Transcript_900:2568-3323(+)
MIIIVAVEGEGGIIEEEMMIMMIIMVVSAMMMRAVHMQVIVGIRILQKGGAVAVLVEVGVRAIAAPITSTDENMCMYSTIIMRVVEVIAGNFWMAIKKVAARGRMSAIVIVIPIAVIVVIDTPQGAVAEAEAGDVVEIGVGVLIEGITRKRNTTVIAVVGTAEIQTILVSVPRTRLRIMETEARLPNAAEARVVLVDLIAGIGTPYLDPAENVRRGKSIGAIAMLVLNGAAKRKKANEGRIGNRRRTIEAS